MCTRHLALFLPLASFLVFFFIDRLILFYSIDIRMSVTYPPVGASTKTAQPGLTAPYSPSAALSPVFADSASTLRRPASDAVVVADLRYFSLLCSSCSCCCMGIFLRFLNNSFHGCLFICRAYLSGLWYFSSDSSDCVSYKNLRSRPPFQPRDKQSTKRNYRLSSR